MQAKRRTSRHTVEVIRGLGLGGAEALLYLRLRDAINRRVCDPEDVTVVNTAPVQQFYTSKIRDLGVTVLDTRSSNPLLGGLDLLRILRRQRKAGHLVVHSPGPAAFVHSALGLRLLRTDTTTIAHHVRYKWLWRVTSRLTNRFATRGIAVSADVLASPSCKGFRDVSVVYGGVDADEMIAWSDSNPSAKAELRASHAIPADATLLCAVGSLLERKGHADLIAAFSDLADKACHLAIIGDGPERQSLTQQVQDLGLVDRVHLIGRYAPAWHWISSADFVCHTSHSEGLPVVLMESLSLGKRVVATRFAGASEAAKIDEGLITIVDVQDRAGITAELERHLKLARAADSTDRIEPSLSWTIGRYTDQLNAAIMTN